MLLCLGLLVHVSNGRGLIEMLISGVFDKTIRRVGIDLEEERCYTEPGVWFDRALQIDERSDIAHSSSTFISSSKICARPFSLSPERQDDFSSGPTQLVDSPGWQVTISALQGLEISGKPKDDSATIFVVCENFRFICFICSVP